MTETEQEIRNQYGKMIRDWRLDRNLGLREFCDIIEISPKILSRIELGYNLVELDKAFKKVMGRHKND